MEIEYDRVLIRIWIFGIFSLGLGHGMAMSLQNPGSRIRRGMARRAPNPTEQLNGLLFAIEFITIAAPLPVIPQSLHL